MRLSSDLSQMTLNSMAWGNIRLDQIRSGVRRERDIVIPTNMSMMIAIMIDLDIVINIVIRGRGGILSSFQGAARVGGSTRRRQKRPI